MLLNDGAGRQNGWPRRGLATILAFFDAELGPRRGLATKKAFFDAELGPMRGFATKKAIFGAERVRGGSGTSAWQHQRPAAPTVGAAAGRWEP